MDAFSPAHQPDEGYSEDPLNPNVQNELSAALSALKSPTDLPAWITANASNLPLSLREEIATALLNALPTAVVADIVHQLKPRLYIDFVRYLPPEICLRILQYLDPVSLVSVIRTCRTWCDLALDTQLWEKLYHSEGWKALRPEIELWEARVNVGLNDSIGHLHRIQNAEGHANKIRALNSYGEDTDVSMSDSDRVLSVGEGPGGRSIFGSPASASPFPGMRPTPTSLGDMDIDKPVFTAMAPETSFSSTESRPKRKDRHSTPEAPLPPILPPNDPGSLRRSTLWMWDGSQSRYRVNWKYLYNMRRRLESNWELGKAVTFQFPHPQHPEEGHQECVYSLQFDNNYLVSGSRDRTLRIWNVHTRRLIRAPLVGHEGSVLCLQFDADPDEDILVSGSSDSNIIIWKFSTGEILQKLTRAHRASVLNVRFDKRVIVTSSKDKTIKIFNRRPLRAGDLGYKENTVYPVARSVRSYDLEPDPSHELPYIPAFSIIAKLEGHGAAVNAIQVRGQTVVSVSGDRNIKTWHWPTQVMTQTIPAHDKGIACVEFDGRRIVSGSSDFDVCIFDAATGLRVAQLRGHQELVRTVQAGFCDLPYSVAEDEAEARRVDIEYIRAVEAGEIEHNAPRRNRRPNAGSSQPTDFQAFGAKLPPGGGGGRRYGRIVSGSYDQTVIIWRRDKEGIWKPAHYLRQEERTPPPPPGGHGGGNPPGQPMLPPPPHPAPPQLATPGSSSSQMSTLPLPNVHDSQPHLSSGVYTALIDQVVPAGPVALRQALMNYPGMLAYHNYLQVTIEREASQLIRAHLRTVVAHALAASQNSGAPAPASSIGATAGSSSSHDTLPQTELPATGTPQPLAVQPAGPAPTPQVQLPPLPAANPLPGHHDPPLEGRGNARFFKLQFDARKIISCRQAPVIVGWDFCNGDPELEEASRFFATVD